VKKEEKCLVEEKERNEVCPFGEERNIQCSLEKEENKKIDFKCEEKCSIMEEEGTVEEIKRKKSV